MSQRPTTRAGRPVSNDGAEDTDREKLLAESTQPRGFESSDDSPKVVAVQNSISFDPATRYVVERKLGEGGMGEVKLCADSFVGRNVAMKVSSLTHTTARARFLREARVQGQLEHPAVVPVYDIGTDAAQNVFFTMKRIVGRTLEEIIQELRDGNGDYMAKYSQRRLLQALGQIALALEFAHQRGVVHRDLKPANVMIGDFGEVYVLDWGIAKLEGADALTDEPLKVEQTSEGSILGTPGYLSPEQAQGLSNKCDGRVDVYALGLMLYEVLTHERVHNGKGMGSLLASTLQLDGARPKKKRPGISAELDDLCYTATRLDPDARFSTARELHDQLERFLDGERDRERRHAQAEQHASRADVMLMKLSSDPVAAEAARAAAMRELGAALALHPGLPRAQEALLDVLMSEPDAMPVKAKKEVDDRLLAYRRASAKRNSMAAIGWLLALPLLMSMGVQSAWLFAVLCLSAIALAAVNLVYARAARPKSWYPAMIVIATFTYTSLFSLIFGPLVMVPHAVLIGYVSLLISMRAGRSLRFIITACAIAAMTIPILLIALGVVANPYTIEHGAFVIHPIALDFNPIPTWTLLVVQPVAVLLTMSSLLGANVESLINIERRAVARSHRMRQLLPVLEDSTRHPL